MSKTITVSKFAHVDVDVDVDMEDFDDEELIDELRSRGYSCIKGNINVLQEESINPQRVYEAVALGRPNAEQLMRDFIAMAAGRVTL